MIKIIKEGILPKIYKTIFNTKCEKCNCEFEFEIDDFTKIEKCLNGNYFIKCPYCGHEIMGKYSHFNPKAVEVEAEDKHNLDKNDLDIHKPLYNIENRKQYVYDDDIAILFYKGHKVYTATCETFRCNWMEEMDNCKDMNDFLDDIGVEIVVELNDDDIKDNWEHIWNELNWNDESKSYKYKNWEWIVLNI